LPGTTPSHGVLFFYRFLFSVLIIGGRFPERNRTLSGFRPPEDIEIDLDVEFLDRNMWYLTVDKYHNMYENRRKVDTGGHIRHGPAVYFSPAAGAKRRRLRGLSTAPPKKEQNRGVPT
jgi:hypothetical protein